MSTMQDIKIFFKICIEDVENYTLLKTCLSLQSHLCAKLHVRPLRKSGFVLFINLKLSTTAIIHPEIFLPLVSEK